MKNFKGKWCINITEENVFYLKEHFKCGAGYYPEQTLFFNEDGIQNNCGRKCSWNIDRNNICDGIPYNEISFVEFQNMVEGGDIFKGEPTYEIY